MHCYLLIVVLQFSYCANNGFILFQIKEKCHFLIETSIQITNLFWKCEGSKPVPLYYAPKKNQSTRRRCRNSSKITSKDN